MATSYRVMKWEYVRTNIAEYDGEIHIQGVLLDQSICDESETGNGFALVVIMMLSMDMINSY